LLSTIENADASEPTRKRYVVNDTTIEKLGELLAENPNGLLLFRDELYGFLKTINREDRANDKAFHLECWAGLGSYTYDRIGRGTVDIKNCIESILGCLTPSKLIPMVSMAVTGGLDDDGFIQRFQLMVYPDHVQFQYVDEVPDKDARDTAYAFFKYVSGLTFEPGEYEKIPTVHFSKEAQIVFSEWLTALEMEISSDDIHPAIESHLAKYRSLIPSLALLIHTGSYDDLSGDIQLDSLEKAITRGSYLKSHALRVYNLAINNSAHLGKLLLEKIKIGKLKNPFVIRDVKQAQWHGLTIEGSVESALKILVEYGYLRIKSSPTGGKPKVEYFVNPAIKI
jgi:putative DNA primase/helicase